MSELPSFLRWNNRTGYLLYCSLMREPLNMRGSKVGWGDPLGFEIFIKPTEIQSFYGYIPLTHSWYPPSWAASQAINDLIADHEDSLVSCLTLCPEFRGGPSLAFHRRGRPWPLLVVRSWASHFVTMVSLGYSEWCYEPTLGWMAITGKNI